MALRADASRNRKALLKAAGTLFDSATDPASVTMEDVALAAGVGKGTLFRRYGSRAGLLHAVAESKMTDLMEAVLSGPPPLGPKTPPRKRLSAVLTAIVMFKASNLGISRALEADRGGLTPTPFLDSQPYQRAHALLIEIISQLGKNDPSFYAHALLGFTRADFVEHMMRKENYSTATLEKRMRSFVNSLFANN